VQDLRLDPVVVRHARVVVASELVGTSCNVRSRWDFIMLRRSARGQFVGFASCRNLAIFVALAYQSALARSNAVLSLAFAAVSRSAAVRM